MDDIRTKEPCIWDSYKSMPLQYMNIDGKNGENRNGAFIFVHGMFATRWSWHKMARDVCEATGRPVYLPDLRNHGESPWSDDVGFLFMCADLHRFLKDHELTNVTLVGHSVGAKILMLYCMLGPCKEVAELVVVESAPMEEPPNLDVVDSIFQIFIGLFKVRMEPIEGDDAEGSLLKKRALESIRGRVPEVFHNFYLRQIIRDPEGKGGFKFKINISALSKKYVSDLTVMPLQMEWQPFLKRSLFIYGDNSVYNLHKYDGNTNKYFPDCQMVDVPDACHMLHKHKYNQCLQIIVQFTRNALIARKFVLDLTKQDFPDQKEALNERTLKNDSKIITVEQNEQSADKLIS